MGTYNYKFDDGVHFRFSVSDVDFFRDSCFEMMPSIASLSERISRCFWFDLLVLITRYGIDTRSVLEALLHLEYGEPLNGVKPATQFTRRPLKGLWHKHWFSARFMASNILAVTQRKDSMEWIWEIAKEGDILTEKLIGQIAHRLTVGIYEDRYAEKKITGEWLIFLPRAGLNYYLCLGTHTTGDKRLYEKIKTLCALDFPEIVRWVKDASEGLT